VSYSRELERWKAGAGTQVAVVTDGASVSASRLSWGIDRILLGAVVLLTCVPRVAVLRIARNPVIGSLQSSGSSTAVNRVLSHTIFAGDFLGGFPKQLPKHGMRRS